MIQQTPGQLLNFNKYFLLILRVPGRALNRYEAFIKERRLFHFKVIPQDCIAHPYRGNNCRKLKFSKQSFPWFPWFLRRLLEGSSIRHGAFIRGVV